jgi:hypothetical protein
MIAASRDDAAKLSKIIYSLFSSVMLMQDGNYFKYESKKQQYSKVKH